MWIKCSERMPAYDDTVFIYGPNAGIEVAYLIEVTRWHQNG